MNLRRVVTVEAQERLPEHAGLPVADSPRRLSDPETGLLVVEESARVFHPHPEEVAAKVGIGQRRRRQQQTLGSDEAHSTKLGAVRS